MISNLHILRKKLVLQSELWQDVPLRPDQFRDLLHKYKAEFFSAKLIQRLWLIGFLRADLIISKKVLTTIDLELITEVKEKYFYLDNRKLIHKEAGYGGSLPKEEEIDPDIELFFHPYRLFVIYHIERVFKSYNSKIQFLLHPQGKIEIANREIQHLQEWTSKLEFINLFDKWNHMAEIAIAFEPCAYERVYRKTKYRFPDNINTITEKLKAFDVEICSYIQSLSQGELKTLNEYRADFCRTSEIIEPNKIIHVLLRLTSWHKDQKIKGHLGMATMLKNMSEIIRRSLELALNINLPEEDEIGLGQWMPNARKLLYGAERVTDAPKEELRNFLADIGIDYGPKVRCYVEGETELGALKYATEGFSGIEIINLRGNLVQKNGRGLAFSESLVNDNNAKIFSFIFLDGDNDDYLRAARKTAATDTFCGEIYISTPDFEFSNFIIDDLILAVINLIEKRKQIAPSFEELKLCLQESKNNKQFFKVLNDNFPQLSLSKGEEWGRSLMEVTLESKKDSSLIKVVHTIIHCTTLKYQISRDKLKINPETGKTEERLNADKMGS